MYFKKSLVFLLASGAAVLFPFKALHAQVVTNGCADPTFCTFPELVGGASVQLNEIVLTDWNLVSSNSVDINNIVVDFPFAPFFFSVSARNDELLVSGVGGFKSLSYEFKVNSLGEDINEAQSLLGFRRIRGFPFFSPIITGNTIFGTTQGSNDLGTTNSISTLSTNVPASNVNIPELDNFWIRNTLTLSTNLSGDIAELSWQGIDASRFAFAQVEPPPEPLTIPEPSSILSFLTLTGLFLGKRHKNKHA